MLLRKVWQRHSPVSSHCLLEHTKKQQIANSTIDLQDIYQVFAMSRNFQKQATVCCFKRESKYAIAIVRKTSSARISQGTNQLTCKPASLDSPSDLHLSAANRVRWKTNSDQVTKPRGTSDASVELSQGSLNIHCMQIWTLDIFNPPFQSSWPFFKGSAGCGLCLV